MGAWLKRAGLRFRREARGYQLVEFALLLPFLLMIVTGTIDFGRAFFSWNIITNGAREGARTAAVTADPNKAYDQVRAAVGALPTIDPPGTDCGVPLGKNLGAWCIQTTAPSGWVRGQPVSVLVGYNFRFLVPGFANLIDVFPLRAKSTMRLE